MLKRLFGTLLSPSPKRPPSPPPPRFLRNLSATVVGSGDIGTVFRHAASENDVITIQQMLNSGVFVDISSNSGQTALHMAAATGAVEAVDFLLKHHAKHDLQDLDGQTALNLTVKSWDVRIWTEIRNCIKLLTDAGATVDGATAKISPLVPSDVIRAIVPEDTPFWLAANNDAPMLAAELAGGLDPNMKTENGMTLLHWACAGDAPECVLTLLKAGAEPITTYFLDSDVYIDPIFFCMHPSSLCLDALLPFTSTPNVPHPPSFSFSLPIHYALAANSPACVASLIRAGAHVAAPAPAAGPGAAPPPSPGAIMRNQPVPRAVLELPFEMKTTPRDAVSELVNSTRAMYGDLKARELLTVHSISFLTYCVYNAALEPLKAALVGGVACTDDDVQLAKRRLSEAKLAKTGDVEKMEYIVSLLKI